ncbi:histidine phosphotransferase family protein [Thalassovita sp.]|uniref:histidine phosphotransferase family protein n=1 Tax=Thalassovita sp. TaxID=1979401 RepID=UPI0029DE8F02|nr:histidine phosphotransferase family protein [Thalassovita sp.]
MTQDTLEFSALIGSRICHDLISPIGAIGNGLELLQMGMPLSPELALVAESVENANARVRFFRVAFGKASEGQQVNRAEVEGILRDISKGGRIEIRWAGDTPPDRRGLRAGFMAVMCLESTLPLGGEITVEYQSGAWRLHATGHRIRLQPDLWALLDQPQSDPHSVSAGQVQFALLPGLLRDLGRVAVVSSTDTTATIAF